MSTVSRNAPCPCGSGKKYKKCCLPKDEAERRANPPAPTRPHPPKTPQYETARFRVKVELEVEVDAEVFDSNFCPIAAPEDFATALENDIKEAPEDYGLSEETGSNGMGIRSTQITAIKAQAQPEIGAAEAVALFGFNPTEVGHVHLGWAVHTRDGGPRSGMLMVVADDHPTDLDTTAANRANYVGISDDELESWIYYWFKPLEKSEI